MAREPIRLSGDIFTHSCLCSRLLLCQSLPESGVMDYGRSRLLVVLVERSKWYGSLDFKMSTVFFLTFGNWTKELAFSCIVFTTLYPMFKLIDARPSLRTPNYNDRPKHVATRTWSDYLFIRSIKQMKLNETTLLILYRIIWG